MIRHAVVAVVLGLVTLSAGVFVDAQARALMAHNPWPGQASATGEIVVHDEPTVATLTAHSRAVAAAQDLCGDDLEAIPVSVAEVSVEAGGQTSAQVEIDYVCL